MRIRWFNVEKVEQPSEEPPPAGKPIDTLHYYVLEEDDIAFYRLFKYGSIIYIYPMHNYFIARQYAYDERTDAKVLYAEYRLTLTDEVWKAVDALLNAPFTCEVQQIRPRGDKLRYICRVLSTAYIPHLTTGMLKKGAWAIDIYLDAISRIAVYRDYIYQGYTTIPFNCGPLRPLWLQAVECWIEKIRELGSKHVAEILDALLQYKYLDLDIVPRYPL